jgi:hypothetical protein
VTARTGLWEGSCLHPRGLIRPLRLVGHVPPPVQRDSYTLRLLQATRTHAVILSPMAGGFDALRLMSSDKVAVLGLVSNRGEVESAEYVRCRLDEATRYLPLDRLRTCQALHHRRKGVCVLCTDHDVRQPECRAALFDLLDHG